MPIGRIIRKYITEPAARRKEGMKEWLTKRKLGLYSKLGSEEARKKLELIENTEKELGKFRVRSDIINQSLDELKLHINMRKELMERLNKVLEEKKGVYHRGIIAEMMRALREDPYFADKMLSTLLALRTHEARENLLKNAEILDKVNVWSPNVKIGLAGRIFHRLGRGPSDLRKAEELRRFFRDIGAGPVEALRVAHLAVKDPKAAEAYMNVAALLSWLGERNVEMRNAMMDPKRAKILTDVMVTLAGRMFQDRAPDEKQEGGKDMGLRSGIRKIVERVGIRKRKEERKARESPVDSLKLRAEVEKNERRRLLNIIDEAKKYGIYSVKTKLGKHKLSDLEKAVHAGIYDKFYYAFDALVDELEKRRRENFGIPNTVSKGLQQIPVQEDQAQEEIHAEEAFQRQFVKALDRLISLAYAGGHIDPNTLKKIRTEFVTNPTIARIWKEEAHRQLKAALKKGRVGNAEIYITLPKGVPEIENRIAEELARRFNMKLLELQTKGNIDKTELMRALIREYASVLSSRAKIKYR